jgi:D-xylose transport system permease protein
MLCSFTAGIAGIVYVAAAVGVDRARRRGTLMLRGSPAVIGGTSLFGGRGKAVHGVLGGS